MDILGKLLQLEAVQDILFSNPDVEHSDSSPCVYPPPVVDDTSRHMDLRNYSRISVCLNLLNCLCSRGLAFRVPR